jgi:hypothetical protein
MKPGISRAFGAALLGFLGSMVFVLLLRWVQGVDPIFDAELAMILGAFVASFAFIWGAGGLDPRMNTHPHEPEVDAETGLVLVEETEEDEHEHEEDVFEQEAKVAPPGRILTGAMWEVVAWSLSVIILLFFFASLPTGLFLRSSGDPSASRDSVGFFTYQMPFGGPEVQMSQLTLLVIFVFVLFVTLGVVGWGLAMMVTSMSRNLTEVQGEEPARMSYAKPTDRKPFFGDVLKAVLMVGFFIILYDFMVRGAMRMTTDVTVVMILLSIGLGTFIAAQRTKGKDMVDGAIEGIKVNSMMAFTLFGFFVMYIIHYEALVGFIFRPEFLRVPLSLGGALGLTLLLTFWLFNDTVSDIIVRGARSLRDSLRDEPEVDTETTAIEAVNEGELQAEGAE